MSGVPEQRGGRRGQSHYGDTGEAHLGAGPAWGCRLPRPAGARMAPVRLTLKRQSPGHVLYCHRNTIRTNTQLHTPRLPQDRTRAHLAGRGAFACSPQPRSPAMAFSPTFSRKAPNRPGQRGVCCVATSYTTSQLVPGPCVWGPGCRAGERPASRQRSPGGRHGDAARARPGAAGAGGQRGDGTGASRCGP